MRVRFSRDFMYTPTGERRISLKYRAGAEYTVKREAGEAAVKAGAAVELKPPPAQDDDAGRGA
jgi:hypothetical protein